MRLFYDWQSDKAAFLEAYLGAFARHSRFRLDDETFGRIFVLCNLAYRVWFLAMVVDRVADPYFVNNLLDEIESARNRLETGDYS